MSEVKAPKVFRTNVLEFYRAKLRGNSAVEGNFIAKFGQQKANELEFFVDTFVEATSAGNFRLRDKLPKDFKDKLLDEKTTENFLEFLKAQQFKFYVKGEKDEEEEAPPAKPARQVPPSIAGLNAQATDKARERVADKVQKATTAVPDADDFMSDAEDNTPMFEDFTGLCEVAEKYNAQFILSKSLASAYKTTTESTRVTYDENVLQQLGVQMARPDSAASSKDGAKMNLGFKKLARAYTKIPVIQYATKSVYAQGKPHMEQLALLIEKSKVNDFCREFAIKPDFVVPSDKLVKVIQLLTVFHMAKAGTEYEVLGFKVENIPFMDNKRLEYFKKMPMANLYSAVFKLHCVNQLKKLGKEVIKAGESEVEKIKSLHPAYKDKYSVEDLEAKGIDPTTMAITFEDPTIYMTAEEAAEYTAAKKETKAPVQVYIGIDFIFPRINGKINLTGKKLLEGGEEFDTAVGLLKQVCLPKDKVFFESFIKRCKEMQQVASSGGLDDAKREKLEKVIRDWTTREANYKSFLHFRKVVAFSNDDLSMGGIFTSDGKISRGYYTYTAQVNSPLGKTHYHELGYKIKG